MKAGVPVRFLLTTGEDRERHRLVLVRALGSMDPPSGDCRDWGRAATRLAKRRKTSKDRSLEDIVVSSCRLMRSY